MDWINPISILFLFVFTIMYLLKMGGFWNSRNNKHFPPGPRPLPIIGNLHIMDMKKPYTTMLKLSKQYGSIFSVQMGLKKVVVLTGYETVKEALVNQADAFAERPFNSMLAKISKGHGLVFAHGENWKVMRRFTLTTLRDYGMGKRTIEDKIVEECHFLIRKFETYEGKPFEIKTIMNASVSNIIVSILLGKRFEYEDPTFLRLLQLINENIQLLGTPSVLLYNLFPALGFLSGAHKTLLNNRDEFQAFVTATFIEHLKDLDENDQRSFIDSFLIRQQEEKKNNINGYFHNDNLIGVVGNLFAAGTETTSTTLRWGLLLMMKYPDIQSECFAVGWLKELKEHRKLPFTESNHRFISFSIVYTDWPWLLQGKVQEEIATVVGSSQPRIEHRTKMPYADAVIHEIQRFGNILPTNLPHATTMDVTLNGYFIPKGTEIMPLLASVLQDETQWEKPYKFYPEHFLDSEGKFVKRDAFMPFSAGRRICVGETLAKMELFLFFTSLLQKFTFQPAPGTSKEDLDLTPADGFTTPPMPYKLCAVPRS